MTAPSASARAGFLVILLAALFTAGLIRLFSIEFSTGGAYPRYSSLNSRPDGAKLLFDGLGRTPGMAVSRNFYPLDYFEDSSAALFLLGLDAEDFASQPKEYVADIERLAGRGNRVVAALRWQGSKLPSGAAELEKSWKVRLAFDPDEKHQHRLYIADAPGWRALDREGDRILAVERDFSKGSVVLAAESDDFANEATAALDRLSLVTAAIGNRSRVVFDEQHLGISESGSVVGLARRFRLTGLAVGLAFCAALFIWKNAAGFPPPADAPRSETLTGRTSISGLFNLLRRHIRREELAATCWNEWLAAHRGDVAPARVERIQGLLRDRARQPLDAVREIQSVLHAKGPL